jgi:hypothetical protein
MEKVPLKEHFPPAHDGAAPVATTTDVPIVRRSISEFELPKVTTENVYVPTNGALIIPRNRAKNAGLAEGPKTRPDKSATGDT